MRGGFDARSFTAPRERTSTLGAVDLGGKPIYIDLQSRRESPDHRVRDTFHVPVLLCDTTGLCEITMLCDRLTFSSTVTKNYLSSSEGCM